MSDKQKALVATGNRRWRTLRDVVVFQIKLALEGLKDIVLGPLSIAAAVIDVIQKTDPPNRYLDRILRMGQRYEEWLDLYESRAPRSPKQLSSSAQAPDPKG